MVVTLVVVGRVAVLALVVVGGRVAALVAVLFVIKFEGRRLDRRRLECVFDCFLIN
jgi:hypothetical protein